MTRIAASNGAIALIGLIALIAPGAAAQELHQSPERAEAKRILHGKRMLEAWSHVEEAKSPDTPPSRREQCLSKAREVLYEALDLLPEDYSARLLLGQIRQLQQRYADALTELRQAEELFAAHPPAEPDPAAARMCFDQAWIFEHCLRADGAGDGKGDNNGDSKGNGDGGSTGAGGSNGDSAGGSDGDGAGLAEGDRLRLEDALAALRRGVAMFDGELARAADRSRAAGGDVEEVVQRLREQHSSLYELLFHTQLDLLTRLPGHEDEARQCFARAVEEQPRNYRFLVVYAGLLEAVDPNGAAALYSRAIDVDPQGEEAARRLGLLYVQAASELEGSAARVLLQRARPHLERAFELKPYQVDTLRALLEVATALGDADAVARYRTELETLEG
jgi:tetratricopeptide (TPR) repeat protein